MPCGYVEETPSTVNQAYTVYSYDAAGNIVATNNNLTYLKSHSNGFASGVCTKGYFKLLRQNKLIPYNPWKKFHEEGEALVSIGGRIKTSQTNQTGDKATACGTFDGQISAVNIDNGALSSFYEQELPYLLMAAQSCCYTQASFDLATFLAELPETVRMLGTVVERLRDIKRGKIGKFKKLASRPGDILLEARYGWRPLFNDLSGLSKVLSRMQEKLTRVSCNRKNSQVSSDDTGWYLVGEDALRKVYKRVENTYTVTPMASVAADFKPSMFQFNPLVTGYEVIPLSFVLDWVWNVGMALESLSLEILASDKTACAGFLIEISTDSSLKYEAKPPAFYDTVPQSTYRSTLTYKKRWPSAVPLIPPIKPRVDLMKIADIMAILAQSFR